MTLNRRSSCQDNEQKYLFVNFFYRDWKAGISKTPAYAAETIAGAALIKLYQNKFKLKVDSSLDESNLLSELQ